MRPGWENVVKRCLQMFLHHSEGQPWSHKCHYQDGVCKDIKTNTTSEFHYVGSWNHSVVLVSAFHSGRAETPFYRFSLPDGTLITAKTRSELCRNPNTNETPTFLSTHYLQRYKSSGKTLEENSTRLYPLYC